MEERLPRYYCGTRGRSINVGLKHVRWTVGEKINKNISLYRRRVTNGKDRAKTTSEIEHEEVKTRLSKPGAVEQTTGTLQEHYVLYGNRHTAERESFMTLQKRRRNRVVQGHIRYQISGIVSCTSVRKREDRWGINAKIPERPLHIRTEWVVYIYIINIIST